MAAVPNILTAAVRVRSIINGQNLPIRHFRITRGAYASVGTFQLGTSIQLASIDINAVAQQSGGTSRTEVDTQVSLDGGMTWKSLLVGDLDAMTWDFDNDLLTLTGRDFGGRLVETRVVMKDSTYVNKTPAQVAVAFAQDVGLDTSQIVAEAGEAPIGFLGEHNMAIRSATPISKWAILTLLARLTGRVCMIVPGTPPALYFAPVSTSGMPKVYTYGSNNIAGITPVRTLKGEYRPFKNSTFQVIVLSYHPQTAKQTLATIVVAGETIQYETEKTIKPGIYKGTSTGGVRVALGETLKNKPVYVYYMHGLTPQECQTKAEALARDISKREFILHGTVDGDPMLNPLDILQVKNNIPVSLAQVSTGKKQKQISIAPFDGRLMFINSLDHLYDISTGFVTNWSAWHLRGVADALVDTGELGTSFGSPITPTS